MEWAPPEHPDPGDILSSAGSDIDAGAHARALAKLLWFHHHALRHDEGFSGIRLSFALSDWLRLAAVYPPARVAFVQTRDAAEAAFRGDPSSFERFQELAALNQHLGDGVRTAALFVELVRPEGESRVLYRVAEPFLIATGRYDACDPFLAPAERLGTAADVYQIMKEFENGQPAGEDQPPKLARQFYERDVATLVGLLALNRRAEEAAQACADALAVLDDPDFRALLAAARNGHLPPPLTE